MLKSYPERLGIIKNRILLLGIVIFVVLLLIALSIDIRKLQIVLIVIGLIITSGSVIFYIYAALNYPGTLDELAFLIGSKNVMDTHRIRKQSSKTNDEDSKYGR
jgi:hypothetical protein